MCVCVCVCVLRGGRESLKDKLNRDSFFIAIVTQSIPAFKLRPIMPPIQFSWEMPSVGGTYFWAAKMLLVRFWCSCYVACLPLASSQAVGNKGRAQAFATIQFTLLFMLCLLSPLSVNTPHFLDPHIHSQTLP